MRARVRAGDRAAFADLYDQNARAVYTHALRLTGNWSEAEEVMSETFLGAWRTRETVDPEGGSLTPWLLGIATHKAHNANRGLRRRLAFLARSPEPRSVEDFADETAGRIDDTRRLASVHAALRRLNRPDREVIALCVGAGLDYRQAAEALGIPVGTVRSRLSRARARLARYSAGPAAREDAEPRGRRGEKESEAAIAALFLREETR
ncbi:RNA polymerase [Streptomyces sp. AS58]|uniref:Sigma-70 family RNA polymerase sigma factor n=1 Tax=Streptomyces cadmiisoli TaxID=2184053 RepID=A0A2Z4J2S1_9ACTN|nr:MULTISPECIES: sigma-70 family RNA polymerase sigma factor [Streptomyces]AWW38723.1 sigma-70 family RNA polymerase sigma factor [Streptomyces cadmiisoli]KOV65679.1 RNA polymerase [Streptomyces sp. AS58]